MNAIMNRRPRFGPDEVVLTADGREGRVLGAKIVFQVRSIFRRGHEQLLIVDELVCSYRLALRSRVEWHEESTLRSQHANGEPDLPVRRGEVRHGPETEPDQSGSAVQQHH
jgi:hypothetical protein